MNVVDSSCWIEFAENSPIKRWVAPIIEDLDNLLVPTIVLYEVYKKLVHPVSAYLFLVFENSGQDALM